MQKWKVTEKGVEENLQNSRDECHNNNASQNPAPEERY